MKMCLIWMRTSTYQMTLAWLVLWSPLPWVDEGRAGWCCLVTSANGSFAVPLPWQRGAPNIATLYRHCELWFNILGDHVGDHARTKSLMCVLF